MAEFESLKFLIIIFGISAITVFTLHKLRIPSIIGFLIAGVLIGPHGLELIKDIHLVEVFAEIGVILLLFTIGLEFSIKNLLALRKAIFIGGFLQVFLTSLCTYVLARLFGLTTNTALVLGFLVALSSTAIVMRLMLERGEIDSPHGRTSLGILIFQDFCVVLFMLLIPILSGTGTGGKQVLWVLLEAVVIITAVIFSARWLVPKALHQIVHSRIRELFVISIIFICLGTAFLTYRLGLSLALGAFIAGLLISESEYSYQAISDILPFKDSFNSLFFISVGMLMDLHFFMTHFTTVLIVVLSIVVLKTITTTVTAFIVGGNIRISLHTGLILSQIGEFSFVLLVAALSNGLITDSIYQIFLSSSIITMIITPLFVSYSSAITNWVTSRRPLKRLQSMKMQSTEFDTANRKMDHVIIIGFGINGRNLALVLKEIEVPYIILELNSQTVEEWHKKGEPIFYGDATSREILHKMGIDRARVVVVSISDPSATRNIVHISRRINRNIYIVVKTAYLAEVQDLIVTGADEIVPAEFETSIEVFSRVLQFYQMPKTLIGQYADRFREDHYRMFIKGETPKRLFHDTIAVMPNVDYESYLIGEDSPAKDTSIRELDIQNRTGALVIAVKRGNKTLHGILSDMILKEGDIVFMIGDKQSLEHARTLLHI